MAKCTFIYSPGYYCDIGPHVFPIVKFGLLHDALKRDGDIPDDCFIEPQPASVEDLHLVHTAEYVADLLAGAQSQRTLPSELPISKEISKAFILGAGGSILACRNAVADGLSMNLGGGFHHAFPDHGEGFCYINDVAVAIRRLQTDQVIRRAAVIDLDVHQGNGTAAIFEQDPTVFTFSMHQENNYPPKRRSSIDLGLEDGTGDEEYLALLRQYLPRVLDVFKPQLIVYVAGVDVFAHDQLGGLSLTIEGMLERDKTVIEGARGRGIPVAVMLGGGYAVRVDDTLRAHHNTARVLWSARGIGASSKSI